MADINGDDGYSDSDIDALQWNDLEELQRHAVESTQQRGAEISIRQAINGQKNARASSVASALPRGNNFVTMPEEAQSFPEPPSSDYGDLDDEILDNGAVETPSFSLSRRPAASPARRAMGVGTTEGGWRKQGYPIQQDEKHVTQHQPGPSTSLLPFRSSLKNHEYREEEGADDEMRDDIEMARRSRAAEAGPTKDYAALEAKVAELLRDRENLQHAVQIANDEVFTKTGEISIVRANQAKLLKEHSKKLADLQKDHTETIERQNAEIRNARAERDRVATENKFSEYAITEENMRAKLVQKKKDPITPKKNRATSFRDGFEDDEIMFISPAKARSPAGTPKAGAKRKRQAVRKHPGQPLNLEVSQSFGDTLVDAPPQEFEKPAVAAKPPLIDRDDRRYAFLQLVLNHRITHGQKRSFEALASFAFPSEPDVALSTLFLDNISSPSFKQDNFDFPTVVGSVVILLWSRCKDEKYYKPLYLILDLVKFILLSSPASTASHLMDEIVRLAQSTADANIFHRYKRSRLKALNEKDTGDEPSDEIDTTACLEILYLTASLCSQSPVDIARLWRSIRSDFVSMVLRNTQPIKDIHVILRLLATSIQPTTFAMIQSEQLQCEQHIIERLSSMLIEKPRPAEGEEPYDSLTVAEMHLQVLCLLEKVCDKKNGGEAFARDPWAIGRLVRLMNDELNAVYDWKYGHECRVQLVNQATRLLFYLRSVYPDLINMQEKLRVHPGGAYKYLIVLTRLAFSEPIFYERGIEEDVVDCAHQMLEDSVTPEEGEALFEAYSSTRK